MCRWPANCPCGHADSDQAATFRATFWAFCSCIHVWPEHLRGSALGFHNLADYIARPLLETVASGRNYTLDRQEPLTVFG
jgi:hypothetical protein